MPLYSHSPTPWSCLIGFEVFWIKFNSKSIFVGCHSFAHINFFLLCEP
jgi:hypothetical protein